MLFSKAIQIKLLVNKFNQERKQCGFPAIVFDCDSYAIGKWSLRLSLEREGCFFSSEISQLSALLMLGGFIMYVGSNKVSPVLHFQ